MGNRKECSMKFLLIHTENSSKYRLVEADTPEEAVTEYLKHNEGKELNVHIINELGVYGYSDPKITMLRGPEIPF